MESTSEFQRFASDLQNLLSIVKRRGKPALAGAGAIFSAVVLLIIIQGPSYETSGKILLEKRNSTSSLTESGKEIGELNSVGSSDPVSNEMEIIRSLPIAQRTIQDLQLKDEKGRPLEPETFLEKKLTVEKIRGTDLLKITYKSKAPQEAAAVVNKLMSIYVENGILIDRSKALMTGKFVSQQLPSTEVAVRKAEDAIRKFKEVNRISDLNEEKRSTEAAVSTIDQKMSESRTALKSSLSRSEHIQRQLGITSGNALQMSSLNQTQPVQEVIGELKQAESQRAVALNRYSEQHPIIIELTNKVNTLKELLQNRIKQAVNVQVKLSDSQLQYRGVKQTLLDDFVKVQADNAALSAQLSSLGNEKELYLKRINTLPRLEQKQRELERQLEASQSTYSMLLKKSQEIRIAINQSDGNARIIEYASIPKKFRIKPILLKLSLGIFCSGLIGVAITFLLEVRDKSIKTVKEAREKFNYTLLGVIPSFEFSGHDNSVFEEYGKLVPQLIVQKFPSSPICEAFRMLHSNLRFMNTDSELKTIVVTSCIPGEGKSTVAANLALTMVQQGLKILLIDSDMRRPMQHRIWETSQPYGLSDLIVGQVDSKKVIHHDKDGLYLLTSGAMPPNPGSLLDSKRMSSLLQQFSQEFDLVIIDTPPLLSVNDARILGNIADGIIVVARPGIINSNDAVSARELLSQLEHKVLGMVVNRIIPQHEPNSYFYYEKSYQSSFSVSNQKIEV
ncbi:GumC family protein [Altericista sp. CCNU0014]|uniref:GumC family protein n=1 Tax=Altericista sp. CCNU0014 TaxID=3082949 RepID=UPI00385151BC